MPHFGRWLFPVVRLVLSGTIITVPDLAGKR
jgi:hypothetical protein